jgi:hypothetical protein
MSTYKEIYNQRKLLFGLKNWHKFGKAPQGRDSKTIWELNKFWCGEITL